ncbi:MAG TPA: Uma2 family endonuclease [Urbifossiella sp.]|nr:Uma2 family endonuclease [Urbifossiella sp.]
MMPTTATKLLTAEEFERLPDPGDGSRQELVRGEVITMPGPNWQHGEIAANVAVAIKLFLRKNKIGRVTVEGGNITERGPDTVRSPDVSFMSMERMPLDEKMDRYAEGAADLCVEVLSPSNTRAEMNEKIAEYFAGGSRLVWVVDPKKRTVTVYTGPKTSRIVKDDAVLDGGDVLPGFACPVAEFFE